MANKKVSKLGSFLLGGMVPLGFLYLVRPKLAFVYFLGALILPLFAIPIAALHCFYLATKNSEFKNRPFYSSGYGLVVAFIFSVVIFGFFRSLVFVPYKISSGSMQPTLFINDFILIDKLHYGGSRGSLLDYFFKQREIELGDVMVYRFPPKPSVNYIHRVIAGPNDEVSYFNKKLSINGKPVSTEALPEFFDESVMRYFKQSQEKLGDKAHNLILDDERPAFIPGADDFVFRDRCNYTLDGVACKVPEGHYFMMGDNRDNSLDSRYLGFVPDANIVGRAFFVWMNFGNLDRIGAFN